MTQQLALRTVLLLAMGLFFGQSATAQCEGFENYPGGVTEGRKTHVLYRDLVKKKQLIKALPLWEKVYENSPGGSVLHFIDGVAIQSELYTKTEDEAKKTAIVEKIMKLYDERIACFSEKRKDKGYVTSMKAYDMYALQYDAPKALATFQEAVEIEGNSTEAYIVSAYADHAIYMFASDLVDKKTMRTLYADLLEIIEANADNEDFAESEAEIKAYFKPYEDNIFDCEYFKEKLKEEYNEAPEDPEVFRPILKTLLAKGCTKEDEFIVELMGKDAQFVADRRATQKEEYEANKASVYKAKDAYDAGNIEGALALYEKAIGETQNAGKKASIQYKMAQIYYAKLKNRSKAREYALQAANNRGGWGKPYMLIGNMYASSGSACGSGRGWNSQIVVWPAIDMWQKAKSVDPSLADEANQQISKYNRYMPDKEEGFQRNIKQGQSVRVGCWIQTSTTARFTNKF